MKKKYTITLALIVCLITISVGFSISYALWVLQLEQEIPNTFTSSCFNVTINDTASAQKQITLSNAIPLTETDGIKGPTYSVTVTNNCQLAAKYDVNLETVSTGAKIMPDTYIHAYLKKSGGEVLFNKKLDSTSETSEKIISTASKAYKLASGTLGPLGGGSNTITFEFKLWMDQSITANMSNATDSTYAGKITVHTAPNN